MEERSDVKMECCNDERMQPQLLKQSVHDATIPIFHHSIIPVSTLITRHSFVWSAAGTPTRQRALLRQVPATTGDAGEKKPQ
jgi:hypothetical protein